MQTLIMHMDITDMDIMVTDTIMDITRDTLYWYIVSVDITNLLVVMAMVTDMEVLMEVIAELLVMIMLNITVRVLRTKLKLMNQRILNLLKAKVKAVKVIIVIVTIITIILNLLALVVLKTLSLRVKTLAVKVVKFNGLVLLVVEQVLLGEVLVEMDQATEEVTLALTGVELYQEVVLDLLLGEVVHLVDLLGKVLDHLLGVVLLEELVQVWEEDLEMVVLPKRNGFLSEETMVTIMETEMDQDSETEEQEMDL